MNEIRLSLYDMRNYPQYSDLKIYFDGISLVDHNCISRNTVFTYKGVGYSYTSYFTENMQNATLEDIAKASCEDEEIIKRATEIAVSIVAPEKLIEKVEQYISKNC